MKRISCIIPYDLDKKILIQHRDAHAPVNPNCWSFFGGSKEGEETPEETAIREAYEELELRLKNPRFFHHEITELNGEKRANFYFMEKISEEEKRGLVLHEGQAMAWVFPKDLHKMSISGKLRRMIKIIQEELSKIP